MSKWCLSVVAGGMILVAWALPPAEARAGNKTKELVNKLAMPIDLENGIDMRTPLKDALDFLSDRYDVTILIHAQAFKDDLEVKEIEQEPVRLPKMKGVPLGTALRLLLDQVQGTVLIRNSYLEVVPTPRVIREIYQGRDGPRLPLVHASFEAMPLDGAMEQLADLTGVSVVMDPRTERNKDTVNALLVNVPLDTAVRVLADMAGLKAVQIDSVFYITSKDNAKTLQAEQDRRTLAKPEVKKEEKPAPTTSKLKTITESAKK